MHVYSFVAWQQISYSTVRPPCENRRENHSFPSTVACIRVYRAVAWQRFEKIRYNIFMKSHIGEFYEKIEEF
jgi:hypothetical protein